jgi:hypothetical protein
MTLNFTLNMRHRLKPNRTAEVVSVESADGRDITRHFLEFCDRHGHPIEGEKNIHAAIYAYGRKYYH